MDDIFSEYEKELENLDESEKLENAFHEMEMIYRSRCVDVPLTSNVTVVEIDTEEKKAEDTEQ